MFFKKKKQREEEDGNYKLSHQRRLLEKRFRCKPTRRSIDGKLIVVWLIEFEENSFWRTVATSETSWRTVATSETSSGATQFIHEEIERLLS